MVRAPRHRQRVRAFGSFTIMGLIRINRKMPATTMVLECSRADTGVGPSMAEGSQGWSPNWADLPVAARMSPSRGRVVSWVLDIKNICCISHEFKFAVIQAIARISPMSPTRL